MQPLNKKLKLPKTKLTEVPFRKLVPNIVTMLALCSGLTSIRYSVQEDWSKAVIFIFIAAILDGLDGRLARMLKASSKFGAELDSLCDFVSFGISPAILMFQWSLSTLPKIGWFFCLLYSMGMALRLARFNTMLEDESTPPYWANYFTGVPAPAAAAIVIMPIFMSFDFIEAEFILRNTIFCGLWMCMTAYLETSKIPTISLKKTKIKTDNIPLVLIFVALVGHFLFTQTWITLGILTIIYILTIPYSVYLFNQDKKAYLKSK